MNNWSNLLKNRIIRNTMAQKKQEIWRRKQINIFYRYGRPLFTINYDIKNKYFSHNTRCKN